MASSDSGGVRVMDIGGRVARERERLIGMTDEERAWRARYLKSQILAPEEPIIPENFNKEYYNPLRRFYRAPLDKVERGLSAIVGEAPAFIIRNVTGKLSLTLVGIFGAWYYLKYNTATWMRQSGWRVLESRKALYPGMTGYPDYKKMKPNEYATKGFEKSPI